MLNIVKIFFSFFCYIVLTQNVMASNVNINPVLLILNQTEPITTMEVTNLSDEIITMQADVFYWTQTGVVGTHTADDMIIAPPFFQIDAHQSQLLRIAWINHPIQKQLTYRVILREIIPRHLINKLNKNNIHLAIAFSIPLFVQPREQKVLFNWLATWPNNHTLKLDFINKGNMTCLITQIKLNQGNRNFLNKNVFFYVLPNQHHTFLVKTKKINFDSVYAMINGEWILKGVSKKI